jgi:acyl carrier protein
VFGPKVNGGFLLDRLTRCDPIDSFVLFSSVASVLGAAGQSNHAAANSFLDLLAHARASRGQAAVSINWGAWSDIGAAADRTVSDRLATHGLRALSPAQGLQALSRAMTSRSPQLVAALIDWSFFTDDARATSGLLDDVAGATSIVATTSTADPAAQAETDLRTRLLEAAEGRRVALLGAFVQQASLRALGMDPSRPIDPRTPLGELGLDSLLSVELRNTLGAALGESLSATLLFDYPTIETLTNYLAREVLGLGAAGAQAVPTTATPAAPAVEDAGALVDDIEDLSDEEVERRLARHTGNKKSRA